MHARAIALAGLAAILVAGCGLSPKPGTSSVATGRETVITEDEIAGMSVRTAWDVVRLRAPRFTFERDTVTGRPGGVRIQAPRSVNTPESPLLVVDGVLMSQVDYLGQIPASEVQLIRILDAEAAEPRYGLRAAGGAIVVETKRAR